MSARYTRLSAAALAERLNELDAESPNGSRRIAGRVEFPGGFVDGYPEGVAATIDPQGSEALLLDIEVGAADAWHAFSPTDGMISVVRYTESRGWQPLASRSGALIDATQVVELYVGHDSRHLFVGRLLDDLVYRIGDPHVPTNDFALDAADLVAGRRLYYVERGKLEMAFTETRSNCRLRVRRLTGLRHDEFMRSSLPAVEPVDMIGALAAGELRLRIPLIQLGSGALAYIGSELRDPTQDGFGRRLDQEGK